LQGNGGILMKGKMAQKRPHIINQALLWEYDLDTFNYHKSFKIVIERVIERGNLEEWREMMQLYTREQILETIEWSAQLSKRDKDFAKLFLPSDFLNPSYRIPKLLTSNYKGVRDNFNPDKIFKQE
jgi:hypothetical protein